jgi:phospholipase C
VKRRSRRGRIAVVLATGLTVALVAVSCSSNGSAPSTPTPSPPTYPRTSSGAGLTGIHKIQHVVVIMQENRSFDSYFGTFPGADGIPMKHGVPTVCQPDPQTGTCVPPYHDPSLINQGGPHGSNAAVADIHGGKMDGFVSSVVGC